jgi:hypothetical protein
LVFITKVCTFAYMSNILSGYLDTLLGPSEKGSSNNRKYTCINPVCDSHNKGKKKLEIQIEPDQDGNYPYNCWVCGQVKGKSIQSLLFKIGAPKDIFDKLGLSFIKSRAPTSEGLTFCTGLPPDYKFLLHAKSTDILAKHAALYLKKRGITREDIIKYQIGYCEDGPYRERIIIPSYDSKGAINYFVARSYDPEVKYKYKYPESSRDIIPFEMYVNWEVPVVLCEGVFDMIAIKRNTIPLLGKTITPALMKKLLTAKIRKIYIALDNDAMKMALQHCETLLAMGKKVFLVSTQEKDPAEMGFKAFLQQIQTTPQLTPETLLKLKLSL